MQLFEEKKMPVALAVVRSVVAPRGLQVEYDGRYIRIYNDSFCVSVCEVDRGTISWEFKNGLRGSDHYQWSSYIRIVRGIDDAYEGISVDSEDRPAGDLEYVARIIDTHLGRPIRGDYSWREKYLREIRDASRYYNFKRKPPADLDPRGREVVELLLWRREGALEAAEVYFAEVWPENGWEFASTEAEVLRSRLRC